MFKKNDNTDYTVPGKRMNITNLAYLQWKIRKFYDITLLCFLRFSFVYLSRVKYIGGWNYISLKDPFQKKFEYYVQSHI